MSKTLVPKAFKAKIDRALHNLYQEKSTTLHPMTLIPIYYRRMFKGDKFDFGVLESILRSEPTFAPLLSNWRLRFEWYFDSDANRYGWIDNNTRLTSEEVMSRRHHTFTISRTSKVGEVLDDSNTIGRGGICDYAGIAPGFSFTEVDADNPNYNQSVGDFGSVFNLDFHLTYLNIIRNYHVNRQFPSIPYIAPFGITDNNTDFTYEQYSLEHLDNLFMMLRTCRNGVNFDLYNDDNTIDLSLIEYYGETADVFKYYLYVSQGSFGGLFLSQYEPDLYQNLLSRDQGLLSAIVSSSADGVTIEEFRFANHLQKLYDKIFVSGGTDRELSRTIWGIKSNRDYDIPELLCVHSEIIGNNLVVSNTAGSSTYNGENITNAPGAMSGYMNARRGASRMQKFEAQTSGSLMCIVSLVPLVSYSQNIERHLLENNFMDEFTPDMARKGFENIPLTDYCALPAYANENIGGVSSRVNYAEYSLATSVGKQVAWLREMTAVNRVHGEFSNFGEKRDWHLLRDYLFVGVTGSDTISYDISPYGNPLAFQYPFVSTTLRDPNFYLQLSIKCDAYRPVPRRFMPNLGD